MARKTKKEAEKTRELLIEAAFTVFTQKGFARTTLNEIAKKAGVTRGAIYWHFKDKAEIFWEVSEQTAKQAGLDWDKVQNSQAESLKDFEEFLVRYLTSYEKDERFRSFYEMVNFRTEWTEELAPIWEKMRQRFHKAYASLKDDLKRLVENKKIRQDIDPHLAALSLFSFTEGLLQIWLFDQKFFSLKEEAPRLVHEFLKQYEPLPHQP
jgi:TetR/AcrR family acrAB operon transcriptional repressor